MNPINISALFNVAVDELFIKTASGAWKAIQAHPISQMFRASLSILNISPVAVLGAEIPISHGPPWLGMPKSEGAWHTFTCLYMLPSPF